MTDISITIRSAGPKDADAVSALVRDAFAIYTPLIGKPPAPVFYDYMQLIETGRVTLCMDDQTLLGIVYIYFEEDGAAMLDVLAVSEAARGRGVATRLVTEAEHQARQAKAGEMKVYTNAVMTGPQVMYPKLGYTETHRGESDGYSRVHYSKAL
ncbi:GNAT family N-acetyltransferase [Celeribacter litoreus]|uniref:GNAT family N-acetyltransferase n=1 Tax=Celeribacter litoreus TaxID=2876714 RepID=UPI001CCFFFB7|nr:GNAT family N-acetyltransferase [Celeribacter litoreus]MCA0042990.1 GNAT family N-acetyltransferase [Celeribacter litoreus]